MPKYFKSVSTQLDMENYNKLLKICAKEGCKPYAILKSLLTDFLDSYPFNQKEGDEKNVKSRGEETGLGEVEKGNKRDAEKDSGLPFLEN